LVKNGTFVSECWLEDFTVVHRVFNLTKDPGIRHCTTTDQYAVATCLSKFCECASDRGHIPTAGNRNTHRLLDVTNQIPIGQTSITLFFRSSVESDVFDAAVFSKFCSLHRIDRVVVKACTNLYCERNPDRLLYLFKDCF